MTTEEDKKEEEKSGSSTVVIIGSIFGSLAIIIGLVFAFMLIRNMMKKNDPNKPIISHHLN